MSDNIFDLVYSDYDWTEHYFFSGPDGTSVEDFEKLCNQILPRAGYRAAIKKSDPKNDGWICWSDVVEALVSLLEEQGYQRVYIDSFTITFPGASIIGINDKPIDSRLGFSSQIITAHNHKIEKKLAEERKARRNSRMGLFKKKTVQIIK